VSYLGLSCSIHDSIVQVVVQDFGLAVVLLVKKALKELKLWCI